MASVLLEPGGLRIALTDGERWAALRRTDLTVPWIQVRSAEAVAEPFRLVRGLRAPGLALPWRTKIGTWRRHGSKSFAVTRNGAPGLRIRLQYNSYAEILVTTTEAVGLAEQIADRLSARHSAEHGTGNPVQSD